MLNKRIIFLGQKLDTQKRAVIIYVEDMTH